MGILVFDLKGYRIDAKLTQEEMGEKLGVNQGMVSYYERGKTRTKLSRINEIAYKLGVHPGELVREIPEDEVELFDHIRKRNVVCARKPK